MYGNRYRNRDTSEQTLLVGIIAVLMVMFMVGFFYTTHKRRINGLLVQYVSVQLSGIAPFSKPAANIKRNLKAADPEDVSIEDIWALANYAGKRLRWVVLPLTLILVYLVYFSFGRVEQFKRKFTMEALLKNNVKLFPEIAPIVNRPRPITEEPIDSGPWRTGRTPLQFALENSLFMDQDRKPVPTDKMIGADGLPLANATTIRLEKGLFLDLPKAEHIFVSQLGDVFEGPQKLKPHQKALAAALLAYAHSDRKAGIDMLNQLSLSFREASEPQYSKRDLKYHKKLIAAALMVYIYSNKKTGITALSQTFQLLSEPVLNESGAKRISRRMAIIAALLIYVYSDRVAGIRMLCQLLPLLNAPQLKESNDGFVIDVSGADELLMRYSTDHKELNQHASYTNCWMSALLEFARGKGVIACSMFIWLRPIERTLWYALNQCGRRVSWPEAAGVRAHIQVEAEKAHLINAPEVEGAVLSLEQSLVEAGYLFMGGSMEERMENDHEPKTA
ncbi:MAG: hypothetical protein PVH87_26235 [Desulfobacteraceae bacterium]|jgi:hypothetical protein